MPGDFSEKFSLMFERFPWDSVDFRQGLSRFASAWLASRVSINRSVECNVSRQGYPLLSASGVLARFAQSAVMRLMTRALVYPSRLRFFLPYPGRKPHPKVQRYVPPDEVAKKRLKDAGKKPSADAAGVPEVTAATLKQQRDQRKNQQRRKVAVDFFEKVLGAQSTTGAEVTHSLLVDYGRLADSRAGFLALALRR